VNYSIPWGQEEGKLYDRLIDDPLGDPYHIVDLLEHEQLLEVTVDDEGLSSTVGMVDRCLEYINAQIGNDFRVFAAELIRPGKYPRIRQMRDVHQFDVGSHLALCHAYAVRLGPVHMTERAGFQSVAGTLDKVNEEPGPVVLGAASVFHDFFKCFRQRRRLPSKVGGAESVTWHLPSGEVASEELSADENDIAATVLPMLVGDTPDVAAITDGILFSGRFGGMLYRLLDRDDAAARAAADAFWQAELPGSGLATGLYVGVTDWMGKGWSQDLVTHRKSRVRSLRDAGALALARLEPQL